MPKPTILTVSLRSLFSINNSPTPRWGSASSHPIVKATVEFEGTTLRATTHQYGDAQLDVSNLPSGDYVISLTPDDANLLKNSSDPVTALDGNKTDKPGTCRYRPLKIKAALKIQEEAVQIGALGPHEGATHGAAFKQFPATILIDWKPDWVACRYQSIRPPKAPPDLILLHRTGGPTPGSAIDEFVPRIKSSHYLVDIDGHVVKLVHEELVASHAGESWWAGKPGVGIRSVGIEIVNANGPFTPLQYESVIRLIKDLQRTYPGINRHGVIAHGDVRVQTIKQPNPVLQLVDRPGCPGVHFDWTQLQAQGLCSKADPKLFPADKIDEEYGGYFKDHPTAKLTNLTNDSKLLRKDKTPYGMIAALQADLSSLGYSINPANGTTPTGDYDATTQAAVDRFRRRYMPGAVPSNEQLNAIFNRDTAIALKRAVLDMQQ